ncbi:hypothetical protein Poly51_56570 [Rubripirellula tenax]|uniref:Phospholipid/glycerol acyltransferase domain-containing protein n=1 Tax=Rubripirellula tenax TaxID=2528015 RepID=A0A5C6EEV7_9BACT|nr:lysophospholipid acyltransferase family protein [Rubripirellula tenax]TWU46261.1 hypothetical protein Poly51_56570 [Rubripirellula tenax]
MASTRVNDSSDGVPVVPGWFQDGFHRFLKPYLGRHFHAVAVDRDSRSGASVCNGEPLVVFGNHPSWWDPLVAHYLNRTLFPERQFFAPIDASALAQYKVFGKLGFYGVELNHASGAAAFLKTSKRILDTPNTAIWMTPEGRFCDARDDTAPLMPGLAHLCSKRSGGWALPLALEYVFWDERLPVCMARLGEPIRIGDHVGIDKAAWNELLTAALRENQSRLSQSSIIRSSEPFDNVLSGRRGAGGTYDFFRRIKSWATGKRFRAQHGNQFE